MKAFFELESSSQQLPPDEMAVAYHFHHLKHFVEGHKTDIYIMNTINYNVTYIIYIIYSLFSL